MKRINIRHLVVSFILVLSLLLGTSCSFTCSFPPVETSPPSSPPSTNATTPIGSEWSIPIGESQAPILPSIADVVAKVKPSVVAINIKLTGYDPFYGPRTQEGAGSGWIIREDGIIITNNHVVEGAENIIVVMDDGRTFQVDTNKVATDWLTDLAVLKIDAENLPAVTIGDSRKLRVGDWVVAIGNSLGLGITAKEGIISRLGVSMAVSADQTLYNLLETSAAINPGNSGGPLVSMAGEVIGITSAKWSEVGVEGMGYAISSQEATPIIEQLIYPGYVVRPFLGIQGPLTVNQAVAAYFSLSINKGALIRGAVPGGPADEAGLKAGDVIVSLNNEEITNVQELTRAIHSCEIGQTVEITFQRGESENTTYATLAESLPPS